MSHIAGTATLRDLAVVILGIVSGRLEPQWKVSADPASPITRNTSGWWRHNARTVRVYDMPTPDERFPSAGEYAHEPVQYPPLVVVDVLGEQRRVTEPYRNVVLSRVNTSCLRLAVFEGEYRWHHHPKSDELFLVVEGRLEIDVVDSRTLVLLPWQAVVIPAHVVHRTRAIGRTVNLTFESLAAETVFV
jgi:mannose-6-phosphate isomerase-like protein (cupin superfamily)